MFCSKCGEKVMDGSKFCANCGAAIAGNASGAGMKVDLNKSGDLPPQGNHSSAAANNPKRNKPGKKRGLKIIIVIILALLLAVLTAATALVKAGIISVAVVDNKTKERVFDTDKKTEIAKDGKIKDDKSGQNQDEKSDGSNKNEKSIDESTKISETESMSSEAVTEPVNNEYILPESSTRLLERKDLENLSAEQCRLARNELYARHGRMFDDAALQSYFESCSWYQGSIPAANFSDTVLSEIEVKNRDFIVAYEKEKGYIK